MDSQAPVLPGVGDNATNQYHNQHLQKADWSDNESYEYNVENYGTEHAPFLVIIGLAGATSSNGAIAVSSAHANAPTNAKVEKDRPFVNDFWSQRLYSMEK